MSNALRITSHQGHEVASFIPEVARLRIGVFREYPFLYEGKEDYERRYLKKFLNAQEAILILVWDGSSIVGASTGLPLDHEGEEIQQPIREKWKDPSSFFYFGESVLHQAYRGKGIGHQFFDLREEYARQLGRFSHSCFCTIEREGNDPRKPIDYHPLRPFWLKRGYQEHPDVSCLLAWQEIGQPQETKQKMIFWTHAL